MTDALPILAEGLGVRRRSGSPSSAPCSSSSLVIELVRRRRLVERYALLWISASLVLVVLAVWDGALQWIADALGILSPPNALFLIGVGALFILALHFSVAFSRLSEETKILAQEVARLDREQRRIRKGAPRRRGGRRWSGSTTAKLQPGNAKLVRLPPVEISRRRLLRDSIGAGAALTLGAAAGGLRIPQSAAAASANDGHAPGSAR